MAQILYSAAKGAGLYPVDNDSAERAYINC
jgi:hypothetical protein